MQNKPLSSRKFSGKVDRRAMFNKAILILMLLLVACSPQGLCFLDEDKPDAEASKKPEYVPGELIVKFKPYKPEGDMSISTYKENRDAYLNVQISSDSIEALKKKYGVTEVDKVFKEPEFINLNNPDSEISKALNKAFPGFEEKFKGDSYSEISKLDMSSIHRFKLSEGADVLAAAAEFSKDPNIEYAEPNYICRAQMVPNDPYYHSRGSWKQDYDDLWGLKKIQCGQAWDIAQGSGIVVAVVDTGIDYNHEDISENIWVNTDEIPNNGIDDDYNGYTDDYRGYDFSNNDPDPMDDHGHGTHVAGTIAGVGNNNKGVIGVAPKAKVMAVKGLGMYGTGHSLGLANCLKYAADNNAHVINNSWGGPGKSQLIEDAVNYAYLKGFVIIAAAGNDGWDADKGYPANIDCVITVGATDYSDNKATFSNYGLKIDVTAPGVDILSLRANGTNLYGDVSFIVGERYYRLYGTSMSAPHVAGIASLVLSSQKKGLITNEMVKHVIRSSADDIGPLDFDFNSGYGRVNAYRALKIDSVCIAQITSPHKEDVFNKNKELQIRGTAKGNGFQSYKLEYGYGAPANWKQIGAVVFSEKENDILGRWDISDIPAGIYYIKLTVTNEIGQDFKDIIGSILIDRSVCDGWPVDITNLPTHITIADLDNDGDKELVVGTSDGYLHVLNHDGRYFSGSWPKKIEGGIATCPAVADINKDGFKEIIIGEAWFSMESSYFPNGRVHVFQADGSYLKPWPIILDGMISPSCSVSVGDIDNNGRLEIITGTGGIAWITDEHVHYKKIYAFHDDGRIVEGWPVESAGELQPCSTPVLADLDKDGYLDIIMASKNYMDPKKGGAIEAFRYNGESMSGFPVYDKAGRYYYRSIVAGDIRRDKDIKIVSDAGQIIDWHGTVVKDFLKDFRTEVYSDVILADVNKDGNLEIIYVKIIFDPLYDDSKQEVFIIGSDGNPLKGWPVSIFEGFYNQVNPIAGDIDGDSDMEILIGCYSYGRGIKNLYAWHHDGNIVEGFPKITIGSDNIKLAMDDLDNDDKVELVSGTDDGKIYVWKLPGKYNSSNMEWPMFQHDPQHTGCYAPSVDTTPPTIPVVTDEGKFTANRRQLYASWVSSDPESGINEYQYRITTTKGKGNPIIRDWTSTGTNNYVTAKGLNLIHGLTYYFNVKAKNKAGLWSNAGISDGITIDILGPCIINKTSMFQKANSPLLFRAKVKDTISGIKNVYLQTYSESGKVVQNYVIMEYNPKTGLYEARITIKKGSRLIPYAITSQDNAGNTSKTGLFYLKVI
jgi:subtilisin family serine protease